MHISFDKQQRDFSFKRYIRPFFNKDIGIKYSYACL
jgi:hypothetical protein